MKIVGLTGGIGCGKSTVAQILKELGAVVYDLDKIGHDVIQKNGGAYKQVLSAFGESILAPDGEIDRLKLGKIVFNNPDALKRLNSIVHPAIDEKINDIEKGIKESNFKGRKVIVMEAAAMLEAGRAWQADEIWVVTCPETSVIGRIKNRPGYSEEVAKSRIHSQITNEERLKKADVVINNDGTPEELKTKVKTEWGKIAQAVIDMKNGLKSITYLQAGPEALDLVAPLWMKLRDHHQKRSLYFKNQMGQMTWEKRKPGLLEKISKGALLVQMAKDKNTLVGYCVSSVSNKNEGEIESIYIEEEYRKQHIGDRFMKTALVWMDARGVTVKTIGVAVGNEEAFGFYQKYGFYPRVTILRQADTK